MPRVNVSRASACAAAVLAVFSSWSCARKQQQQPVYSWGAPYQPVQSGQPTQPGTLPGAPGQVPATSPTGVATIAPTAPQVGGSDAINNHDITFLRKRAEQILAELVAALPPQQQARVAGIPLVVDATPGEVNAFASCSGSRSAMAITDGLLQIQSQLARFRAYDELGGTNKVGEYIGVIARGARPKQPLPDVPAGFVDPRLDQDSRKVARQYQILDEELAFVMGHELGHHYLGHLPCTAAGGVGLAEINAILSNAVPVFNQPNELAADMVGINNTLSTGARRTDYKLTEGGAMLTMQFFAGLDQLTPADILFGFERSHPPPQLRTPVIQQTAATWRATGGVGLPIITF